MLNSKLTSEIFTRLLSIPDNKACFDCQTPEVSFASINHGIFLCKSCSQIHKKELVNISTIKSIENDSWTEPELNMMIMGGNIKFRNFCEIYRFPKDYTLEMRYSTVAVVFYREMLHNQLIKKLIPEPPSIEDGSKLTKEFLPNINVTQESYKNDKEGEMIDKAFGFFEKVSSYTKQKIKKIEEKINDPGFKEDVKFYGNKVVNGGKELGIKGYSYIKEKFADQQTPQENPTNYSPNTNDTTNNLNQGLNIKESAKEEKEENYESEFKDNNLKNDNHEYEENKSSNYQFPNPDDKFEKTLDYIDKGYEKIVSYEYGKKFKALGSSFLSFSKKKYGQMQEKWNDPQFQEDLKKKKQTFIDKTKEGFENIKKKL